MRKLFFTLFFIFSCNTLMSQFSIGLNGGVGSTKRDIPKGYTQSRSCGGVALDIEYKFDSIPIVLNLSPYLITQSRFEQFVLPNQIVSIYNPEFVIMSGLGASASISEFIQLYASLQFGYWYTERNTITYPGNDESYTSLNQFSLGPKFRLALGKGKLKTIFEYEDHILSRVPEPYSSFERFSRVSIGLLYSFK